MNTIVYQASFTNPNRFVFVACAAKVHNADSVITGRYYLDIIFLNEDDFHTFNKEVSAYETQQDYLEGLSDEELAELKLA